MAGIPAYLSALIQIVNAHRKRKDEEEQEGCLVAHRFTKFAHRGGEHLAAQHQT